MSASIGSTTTASAARTRAADGARPQVQSRRVSLKLGPLGITYSTDQVFWTPEAAEAAGAAASPSASASPVDEAGAALGAKATSSATLSPGTAADAPSGPVDPVTAAEAVEAREYGGASASRSFHLELAAAWRRELDARAHETLTYGPDGAARSAGGASAATASETAGAMDSAQPGRAESVDATAAQASKGQPSTARAGVQANATSAADAQKAETPPAALMRRAIGAYLLCARQFSAAGSMLTAVA